MFPGKLLHNFDKKTFRKRFKLLLLWELGFYLGKITEITGPVSRRRKLPARTEEKEGNLQVGKRH